MSSSSAAWKHGRHHTSSSVWAVFRAAATLRLRVRRAAPATASKAAPKCSPRIPRCAHTYTSNFLFSSRSRLLQLCAAYDTRMPRKRSSSQLCCWLWLRPPGCRSSVVPCEVGSAVLRGSEVVTEESMKGRWRCLWNLPLLILRTGGWGGEREDHLFLTEFSVCNYLYPLLLLWYAQIWTKLHCVLQPNSWLELEKYSFTPALCPDPQKDYFLPSSRNCCLFSPKTGLSWQKKKKLKKKP